MINRRFISSICLVLVFSLTSTEQYQQSLTWATALTGKNYLLTGEDLNLTCTQETPGFSDNIVSFKLSYPHVEKPLICIPPPNFRIINATTALLTVHNVSLTDAGQYTCYAGNMDYLNCQNNTGLKLIGLIDVNIEYPPQKVMNVECVIYDWDVSMTCTWEHPVDYVNKSNINVTAIYGTAERKPVVFACPNTNYTGCKWSLDDGTFSSAAIFGLQVVVTNTYRHISASVIHVIDTFKIIKPSPVVGLAAATRANKPGCILLSWQHPRIHRSKMYRVQHQTMGNENFTVLSENITNTKFLACGYHPFTHHNFSVECYPASIYSGSWSESVYVNAWTPMTAPDLGPETTNGSFTSTQCVRGARNVTVMWKEVNISAKNGIIDGYLISLGKKNLTMVKGQVYSADVELPCDRTSELNIFAHNKGGQSQKPSVLLISPVTSKVPEEITESFSVEIPSVETSNTQGDSLRASWKVSEKTRNLNFTIFWCVGQPGQACQSNITWSQVPDNESHYNESHYNKSHYNESHYDIPLPGSEAGNNLFGIAVTDTITDLTSGIFWTECIFIQKPSYLQSVSSMDVWSRVKSVMITWNPIDCTYHSRSKVTQYVVKWCRTSKCNNTEEIWSRTVPSTLSSYVVSPLEPNVKYSFTVIPEFSGIFGDELRPWKDAVPAAALATQDDWTLLGAILGGLAGAILTLTLILCLYRKCRTGRVKVKMLVDEQRATPATDAWDSSRTSAPAVSDNGVIGQRHTEWSLAHINDEGSVSKSDRHTSSRSSQDSDGNFELALTRVHSSDCSEDCEELCDEGSSSGEHISYVGVNYLKPLGLTWKNSS